MSDRTAEQHLTFVEWFRQHVVFVSWHRHWKGIYIHFVPGRYCYRVFLWGIDRHERHALRW
jgi:hypothetical protein